MDKEQLIQFLRENLEIRLHTDHSLYEGSRALRVEILIADEVITSDFIDIG